MCGRGVCMVGGMHGRGHAWHEKRPLHALSVRILLECILVAELIFTARNEVGARLCFYRRLSFC